MSTEHSTERRRPRVRTVNDLPSRTVQSDVGRAEIANILAKHQQTGIIDHLSAVDLQFRDVSEFEDFADLMRQTKEAEKVFMALPSKLREVFNHDVMTWLDVAHDSTRLEELRPQLEKLGLSLDPAPQPGDILPSPPPPPPPAPEVTPPVEP